MTEPTSEEEILERVQAGQLSLPEAKELLQKLKAAEEPSRGQLRCQVGKSGGISIYGLGRFPVTLYVEQWERLLGFADGIRRFAAEHSAELKKKGSK